MATIEELEIEAEEQYAIDYTEDLFKRVAINGERWEGEKIKELSYETQGCDQDQ